MAKDDFTAQEKAAMKERAAEAKADKRAGTKAAKAAADAEAVTAKIAEMGEADRVIAEGVHAAVAAAAPDLVPRLWYGMPAYARGKDVVCFYQAAEKFGTRYGTLGFSDKAALDDGELWPSAYAVACWTPQVEGRIMELIRRAAGEPGAD
ncbi:MAG: hypothetical protein IPK37_06250 [Austwickia sp.]|jgi:uncharacterized protein YdhG (YjbR/CyaY superfamily)|nr:MAG: hypothetical protein IPK37_06250 [Austwickia sp.]